MTDTYDLILKNGTVVTPGGAAQTDIGVRGERIAHIGDLSGADAGEIYDATGLHIGEPIRVHKLVPAAAS